MTKLQRRAAENIGADYKSGLTSTELLSRKYNMSSDEIRIIIIKYITINNDIQDLRRKGMTYNQIISAIVQKYPFVSRYFVLNAIIKHKYPRSCSQKISDMADDFNSDKSVSEIAKKHGCSRAYVYKALHIYQNKGGKVSWKER